MNSKLSPIASALAWVTLPLTEFHYSENWNRIRGKQFPKNGITKRR